MQRRQSKARITPKSLPKLFKASLQASADVSKDILQLLKEKFIDDASSSLYQADVLYIVNVYRRKITGSEAAAGSLAAAEKLSSSRQGRYLVIVRKAENPYATLLLRIFRKDSELEVKHMYDIQSLRSMDYGSEENELMLCFESTDVSVHLYDATERDQTLWIITQVYKAVVGSPLSTGYSVDIDTVSYAMATSNAIGRFPSLQALVSMDATQLGDRFSADEAEAEAILDQLQWSKSLSEQMDIHQILSSTSDKLNHEIIDFLLQWEEMDDASSSSSRTPLSSSSSSSCFGLKDTKEVLVALSQVDGQLDTVDRWLGEQIERLSEIQSNLFLIEDESGALETSWTNLNVVQEVVQLLVSKYALDEAQETILQYPERALGPLLKLPSLNQVDKHVLPLVQAAALLRDAVKLRTADLCGLTAAQWKQIQSISAISAQKSRLAEISATFCSKLGEWAVNLFDWLLKHKQIADSIVPKAFTSSRAAIEEICFVKFDGFMSNPNIPVKFRLPRSKYRAAERNQLLEAQALYHNQVSKFADLLDMLVELNPEQSKVIVDAYQHASFDRLYGPLIKAFAKDLQAQLTGKQVAVTLASCPKYRPEIASNLLVRFDNNKVASSRVLTSWRTLEVALLLTAPLVDIEEAFIKKIFHLDGRRPEGSSQTALTDRSDAVALVADAKTFAHSRLHSLLVGVFETLIPRLLSLSNAPAVVGETDGVEAIAMLAVLNEFIVFYSDRTAGRSSSIAMASDTAPRASISAAVEQEGERSFYSPMVFAEMQAVLEQRIQCFTTEQSAWIHAQKGDPKSAAVFAPFCRFPTLVLHVMEMTHGQQMSCVDESLYKIAKELFSWLNAVAKASDKYADKIKITNFSFFLQAMTTVEAPALRDFVHHASQQLRDCTVKYLQWMVAYEFPSLSALATRIDGVSNKVSDEELSLYIRRKDVLSVVKELESRTVDSLVASLRKRVEKHFRSDFDQELRLVDALWLQLKERVVSILTKLEIAATVSYQINLEVGPTQVAQSFDKQALAAP